MAWYDQQTQAQPVPQAFQMPDFWQIGGEAGQAMANAEKNQWANQQANAVRGAYANAEKTAVQGEPYSEYLIRLAKSVASIDPNKAKDIYDLAYKAQYAESQQAQRQNTDVKSLLSPVASKFMNIDPADQNTWTNERNMWIMKNPNLASFIPERASQESWDAIQKQGGGSSYVSPKGEFAEEQQYNRNIDRTLQLSQATRSAGNTVEADRLANVALAMSKQGQPVATGPTPDQIFAGLEPEMKALESRVSADSTPNFAPIFAQVDSMVGQGETGDRIKERIQDRVNQVQQDKTKTLGINRDIRSEGRDIQKMNDSDQRSMATQYNAEELNLSAGAMAIKAAKDLFRSNIGAGASALASKFLQKDVLAEAEIKRYIAGSVGSQFLNNIKNAVGLAPNVESDRVADLINTMIEGYNQELTRYNNSLSGNKYKKKYDMQSALPIGKSGTTQTQTTRKIVTDAKSFFGGK